MVDGSRFWPVATCAALFAMATAGGTLDAAAQQADGQQQQAQPQQQMPKPVVKATHGDWVVKCQTLKVQVQASQEEQSGGKSDKADAKTEVREVEQCGMSQRVFDAKNKNIFLNVVVLKRGGNEKAPPGEIQLVAPLGVFLPGGVAMEIDSKPIGRVGFLSCQPYGCVTVSEITAELLDQMRKGGAANMIIYVAPGQGVGMSVSLKGFSAAFDEL